MALPVTRSFTGVGGAIPTADETNWAYNRNNAITFTVSAADDAIFSTDNTTDTAMHWTGDTFNDDHYSECTLNAVSTGGLGTGYGPAVRMDTATTQKTYVRLICSTAGYELIRFNNAATTVIVSSTGTTFANNDLVRLSVQGTTYRMYKNGVQFGGDQTDTSLTSGAAGVAHSSTSSAGSAIVDWSADNLTVSANAPSVNDTATITEDITVRAHLNVKMQKLGT